MGQPVLLDAPENSRKHQGVVDLVDLVTSSASVYETSIFHGLLMGDFGVWVCHRENDGPLVHALDPLALEGSFYRHADKNVSPFYNILKIACEIVSVCEFRQCVL